jgi:hypothetical protein
MKLTISHSVRLILLANIVVTLSNAGAATLVLDDFTQGAFALQFDGPINILQNVLTPLTDLRSTSGRGDKDWHATLADGSGVMSYTMNLRGEPNDKTNWLDLSYGRRSGGFSILGYEAFSLSLTNLVGKGEIMAYSGGMANGIAMAITGPGEMVIPYSNLNTTTPLGDLSSLHFRFIGLSSDFSVTVDRIALVPEPGSLGLFAGGVAILLATRRRRRA